MLPTVQTWTPLIARFGSRAAAYERDADPQCRRTQAATGRAGNWSMGHGSMGHMGHGSRHGDPWPINLVTDMNGRDGFFGQVREAIVSLPRSRVALVCLSQVPVSHMTIPPLLMLASATYHPLRNGKLVRLTGFIVLQSQLVFHQHLQPEHLWHRWRSVYWEKSEVMRLNLYCVMLKVMFLILSAGGGSMDKCIPYCLIVRVDYSLFQHRLQNANDISVLLMPGTSSHLSGTWCFLKLSTHCL